MKENTQNLEVQEKKKGIASWLGWLSFGLLTTITLFLDDLAGYHLAFWGRDEAVFTLLLVYLAPLPAILVLALFLFSRMKVKIKIILILIILPFILRAIFGLYYFPKQLAIIFEMHAKRIENTAIESNNAKACLKIGEIFPFSSFIFPPRVAAYSITHLQKDCVIAVAVVAKDESLCDVLVSKKIAYPPHGEEYKIFCYTEVAKIGEDASICENTADPPICYQETFLSSKKYGDMLEKCRFSDYPYYPNIQREECIKNVAIQNNEIELCKALMMPDDREECYKHFE